MHYVYNTMDKKVNVYLLIVPKRGIKQRLFIIGLLLSGARTHTAPCKERRKRRSIAVVKLS